MLTAPIASPQVRVDIRNAVAARPRGGRAGVAALLVGKQRAAREAAALAFGKASGLPVYRVDLGRLQSRYIGETEKNLDSLLEMAADGALILFFDEADALFGRRTDVRDAHDRYANLDTGYLLARLERFPGLAVLGLCSRPPGELLPVGRPLAVIDLDG